MTNDYFSKQAPLYAKYRPHYPAALFEFLASLVSDHQLAWDCATGSGQAAISLTPYFERIFATDPSQAQIQHAFRHERIDYVICSAEQTPFAAQTVDLITVAQALHWFHIDQFFLEAKRVLKLGGVISVWGYGTPQISSAIDAILKEYLFDILGMCRQKETKWHDEKYQTIPFPFAKIDSPNFKIIEHWNLHDLIGHLQTWSPAQIFIDQYGYDPIIKIKPSLQKYWTSFSHPKQVVWDLYLRVGRQIEQ